MRRNSDIIQAVKGSQERIFRLAKRDYGLTLKAISLDTGIDYDSLCNYAKGDTQMPVAVLYALIGVVPAELLSLLLPDGHLIVQVAEGVDYDDISARCRDFIDTKERAHHPESEAGRDIGPGENEELAGKVVRLRA